MGRKGNAAVEAAMVFPLVILSVVALIYMMLYFYQQTETRAEMHIALRAENGRLTETVFYGKEPKEPFPVYRKAGRIYSQGTLTFTKTGLLRSGGKELFARKYIVDEAGFIRLTDLLKEEERNESQ